MNRDMETMAPKERIFSDILKCLDGNIHIKKKELFEVIDIPNNSKEILEKAKAFLDANGFNADFVIFIYDLGKKDGSKSSE